MRKRDVDAFFWHVGGELQRMNDEMMRVRPQFANRKAWEPRVDLFEDQERLILKAEIAGVKGEEIQLLYVPERHAVILKGKRNEEDFSEGNCTGAYQLEIYYGDFEREIRLPDVEINSAEIRASYRNGFLIVTLPKRIAINAPRNVAIESF